MPRDIPHCSAGLVLLAWVSMAAAQPLTRVPATSLQPGVAASVASYSTERAFPDLSFTQPVAVVAPPGESSRLFVVEKPGRIWVIPDITAAAPTRTLFLDISARVTVSANNNDERGLLALAFHPDFSSNGLFYVWYTVTATTAAGGGLHNRLARFRVSDGDPSVADPLSEQPLITQRDEAANHNGGQVLFSPDGYLYLSLGDEGGGNDQFQNSQRIDKDFFSGVIRIDVDRRPGSLAPNPHPAVHADTYSVPPDNPFVTADSFNGAPVTPGEVRTEFWATGLRNPWRMAFDPATGQLWCGDVGQGAREEINVLVRGGNYGWNYREGDIAGPRANPPASASFVSPIFDYPNPADGRSVTGGIVYRGSRYPALIGHYLFADFVSGRIWALQPDGVNPVPADNVQLLAIDGGISSFGVNPATGDILLCDLTEGALKRLVATSPDPGEGPPGRIVNLAARARVSNTDPLIAGFVIAPGAGRKVLVRGIGPTLGGSPFSVPGALPDPVLTVLGPDSNTRIAASNDDWSDADGAAFAAVGAFALPPGSRDAAVVAQLEPGSYTALLADSGSAGGVGLVEVYDAGEPGANGGSSLVNTAVRALVGTGADVLIPGLVVSEGAPRTVLIRAVGPGIAAPPFNVTDVLAEPVVTLFAGAQAIATNTGWSSAANAAEIREVAVAVGAFALADGSRDSALLVTLPPGAYTIQVSGVNNTTGAALVEVYEVP